MTGLLSLPQLYHAYQSLGGFFQARLKTLACYVELTQFERVFDIGCGPGHIAAKIPQSIDYVGFDVDKSYIRFANAHFAGPKRRFLNRVFDATAAEHFGSPDLIMMNGLLHHLEDASARIVMLDAWKVLKPGGMVITLDGCFVEGQNPIDRYLLEHDRGEFARTEAGYRSLIPSEFRNIDVFLRNDISRIPYTFIITRLTKT